jgi:hypothetical protein
VIGDVDPSVLDRELEEEEVRGDKWFCTCGNEWNTFDTSGVCPEC